MSSSCNDVASLLRFVIASLARNEMLLKLFMVPEFREGVLAFQDHDENSSSEDGLMWHLQSMFSHLQVSDLSCARCSISWGIFLRVV